MADSTEEEEGGSHAQCCIFHLFLKAATRNLNKVAVIHAAGGATLSRELHNNNDNSTKIDQFFHQRAISTSPQLYPGDRCFTFVDILASIDYFSFRIHSALHGGYDTGSVNCFLQRRKKDGYVPKIVAIYMPPSVEYIISVLSVLRCGEAFLPLDPWWPRERILSILSSSNVQLLIVSESSFSENDSYGGDKSHWVYERSSFPVLNISMEECLKDKIMLVNPVWPCEVGKRRKFGYLMYTSGSTGKPKGVYGTEEGILNRFLWMQEVYPLHGEEILLFKTSNSFIDHLQEFLGAILSGCSLVIPPFRELKDNIFSVADVLEAYSINRLVAVPSLMRAILPALQNQYSVRVQRSLKLLIMSGEVLPLSLWRKLAELLPDTTILNLYGSTEVSGDCTYFDCNRLPKILETEAVTSVPIGVPISGCDVVLVGDGSVSNKGEICVAGVCVSSGYFSESTNMSLDFVKLCQNSCGCSSDENKCRLYFRTGDFARQLQSGDLVFLGRNDHTIKINGQRIALEEIENTLRAHPNVADAAVLCHKGQGEHLFLEAFLILNEKDKLPGVFSSSVKNWMVDRLPMVMVPTSYFFTESFPMSSSGKVDYNKLKGSSLSTKDDIANLEVPNLLEIVKKTFCDALMIEDISDDDDFFALGGTSLSAAQVAYHLGIDMRVLYNSPSPSKLQSAILERRRSSEMNSDMHVNTVEGNIIEKVTPKTLDKPRHKPKSDAVAVPKKLKMDSEAYVNLRAITPTGKHLWDSPWKPMSCSITRCNKILCGGNNEDSGIHQAMWLAEVPRERRGYMQELWKVNLRSCVDASPIIVFKGFDAYIFIGSHSHKFMCIDARSGSVQWEIELEGRVECSAAVINDFSEIVVGCYKGKIYFLNFLNGNIKWTFQTHSEVKSQPVLDIRRQLIWCGVHDHNLYALDYRNHCCIFEHGCGGSVFGSPVIDEVRNMLYVASTSGRVTAISLKVLPFSVLWMHELEVPVFGSLAISPTNGNVICCLVDGHVIALDSSGSILWKSSTGGPIFAGACISYSLPSQVLVCSRNGCVYSFELENGGLVWEFNAGDPITASVFVDESLQLVSNPSVLADKLVCVCTSSGSIYLLRINLDVVEDANGERNNIVEIFATLNLPGDIFSSPVMINGRIFVGCRDDNLYCIDVGTWSSVEK